LVKRVMSLCCCALLVFSICGIVYAGGDVATITPSKAVAKVGETFDVTITLRGENVKTYGVHNISFNEKVFELIAGVEGNTEAPVINKWDSETRVLAAAYSAPALVDETILTLQLKVKDTAVSGTYDISFDAIVNKETIKTTTATIEVDGLAVSTAPTEEPDDVVPEAEETDKVLTSLERKKDVICLKINKNLTITYNVKTYIDDENPLVVPYINNGRTMVPLRFISEALQAEVLWEEGWDGCIVKKGDKEIQFVFNSNEFTVNGETYTYEAPIEMLYDRTMVPVRFVSEHLDCDVYWEPINSAVVISPKDNPWVPQRQIEITAINEMLLSIMGII